MFPLLARSGHFQMRKSAYSIQFNGKRVTPSEAVWVECKARLPTTLSQNRSYGDEGSFRIFMPKRKQRTECSSSLRHPTTRQQQGIHDRSAVVNERDLNALDAVHDDEHTSSSDPTQNTWSASEQAEQQLWESFERDDEEDRTDIAGEPRRNASVDEFSQSSEEDKMLDFDYKSQLPSALLEAEADMVIRCLFAALNVNDREFIQNIPASTFSEIIRVLEPRNFMSPLASVHRHLSAHMARRLGIGPMREVVFEYASVLKEVVAMRRGVRMTLSDYKTLLRSARDLGNRKFAILLWNILYAEGHTPDTKCYNLYMSSAVWNGLHSTAGRHKHRVIDFNMKARKKARPRIHFRHYRVGAGGVREAAMIIFKQMLANEVLANEESFRILITAAAREGDIATTKSIFKKVWNVDIDALLSGEDESAIPPKQLPTHSALYPTPQLLFVIAHAFGINNDIPAALRIVDFVARHYQIPVTRNVWEELFEWTFVLSIDRYGTDLASGSGVGQLPLGSVMKLWDTMTSDPYRIDPTMGMYNHLMKNLFQRGTTALMAEKMYEGRTLYYRHQRHARLTWAALQTNLRGDSQPKRNTEKLRHEFEAADLVRRRDMVWLKRWVRLHLATYRASHRHQSEAKHFASLLPQLLWDWRQLAPTLLRYETPTGFVELAIRSSEDMDSHARVEFERKSRLSQELKGAERYVGERWVTREVRPAKRLLARN